MASDICPLVEDERLTIILIEDLMKNRSPFLALLGALLALWVSPGVVAQKQALLEASRIEVMYKHTALRDTITRRQTEDVMVLRVGDTKSQFFSHYTLEGDTISKRGFVLAVQALMRAGQPLRDRPGARTTNDYLYRGYPTPNSWSVYTYILADPEYYTEPVERQDWEMLDSTKMILNYECQLARSQWRGRSWYAWFATDIPYGHGPWKLHGLPGLILEAYDADQHYTYTAIGLKTTQVDPIMFYNPKQRRYKKTSRGQHLQDKAKIYFGGLGETIIRAEFGDERFSEGDEARPRNVYDFQERDY